MNLQLNPKTILDRCGSLSFKRGEEFYYKNKVEFQTIRADFWEASVNGVASFHVRISAGEDGTLETACDCPKLASIDQDCQHVAAVLIAIYHNRQKELAAERRETKKRSDAFLTLFEQSKKRREIGAQHHFETRQSVDLEVILSVQSVTHDRHVFGLELFVNRLPVLRIREFFLALKENKSYTLAPNFDFNLDLYCFKKEHELLVQELIKAADDELDWELDPADNSIKEELLLVSPTSWETLFPHLIDNEVVLFEADQQALSRFEKLEEMLPLTFRFEEGQEGHYLMAIKGFEEVLVLKDYNLALVENRYKVLEKQDAEQLAELKRLVSGSASRHIQLSSNQVGFIKERVLPRLRRMGRVTGLAGLDLSAKPPQLKAKLFLDRIRNRLLAGLEFHYDQLVIDPFQDQASDYFIERDFEKENQILALMKESDFTQTDGGYYLHNEALEYQFLANILPKLQSVVQIYATTSVRNRISKDGFRPQIRVRVKKDRTNWLEFKFSMDGISNDDIRELLGALEEKRPYYRLPNDTLLSLETRDFDEIRKFLQKPEITSEDLLSGLNLTFQASLQLLETVEGGSIFNLDASYKEILQKLKEPERMGFQVPEALEPILRDYQKNGFYWLKTLAHYGFGGILADDMGLGKTLQSITYMVSELANLKASKQQILVVCPASLTYNWLYELGSFAPDLRVKVVDGAVKTRRSALNSLDEVDVIITSYPLIRRDVNLYEKETFHTIFFDEAQNFKNPLSQTARSVKRLKANHRFALTGTPLENALEELWAIFHVVFPELFQGLKEFSTLNKSDITKRIQPFMLRRMKKDVLSELPKKEATTDAIELFPEQKQLYAAYLAKLRHDTLKHLDKETLQKNRIRILAGLTRLRQICCHPGLFVDGYKGRSAKFEYLMNLLEQAEHSGRRVLIFSQFTKMLAFIRRELTLQGKSFFYLDGETSSEDRVELCSRFNSGERNVFLISLKAGGTGLNLTGADTVILYDTWWNPAVEEQATDRAYRMGQTKDVQVIKLVSLGTIEEKMNDLQDKKRELIEEVIDGEGIKRTTLTEEDLRTLLNV